MVLQTLVQKLWLVSMKYWRTRAAVSVAAGDAIEVPAFKYRSFIGTLKLCINRSIYSPIISTVLQLCPLLPLDLADSSCSPGATRSGLMRLSYTGPLALNQDTSSMLLESSVDSPLATET